MKKYGYDAIHRRKFPEQKFYIKYGGLETDLIILGKDIKIDNPIPFPNKPNKQNEHKSTKQLKRLKVSKYFIF